MRVVGARQGARSTALAEGGPGNEEEWGAKLAWLADPLPNFLDLTLVARFGKHFVEQATLLSTIVVLLAAGLADSRTVVWCREAVREKKEQAFKDSART